MQGFTLPTTKDILSERVSKAQQIKDGEEKALEADIASQLEYAAAPEIIKKEPYTRKVDSWGIGVIMYFTLMGQVCGCARAFYTDQIGVW